MEEQASLSRASRLLGYAGIAPQAICVALVASGHEYAPIALATGVAYAAAIFSFLGGVWWGQAITSRKAGADAYIVAIMPSLLAVGLFVSSIFGWEPALLVLGTLILLSPMVDQALGFAAPDFLKLRWHLSAGLGGLTIALGLAAEAMV